MQTPSVFLLCAFYLSYVATVGSGQACLEKAAECEKAWNLATGSLFDAPERCARATEYRACLERECQMVDMPFSLRVEENLQCNLPQDFIQSSRTPCENAQILCHSVWSRDELLLHTGEERCTLAQEFRECLLKAETELRCRDFGTHTHVLERELQVNCVGAEGSECVLRQEQCDRAFQRAKAKAASERENCVAAKKYRLCLVTSAHTADCLDSVKFPKSLDAEEAKHCPDYVPRPSCQKLEAQCRSHWDIVSGRSLPHHLLCKHARKWLGCLERIIVDGGCPGGYTVDVEAQVEKTLKCHIAVTHILDECNEKRVRCWIMFEVKRKYLDDKEAMCDNVEETKTCYQKVNRDDACSSNQDSANLAAAEELWCRERKERIRKQKCEQGKKDCKAKHKKDTRNLKGRVALCDAATKWQNCFTKVVSEKSCVDTALPQEILSTVVRNCYQMPPAKTQCQEGMDVCKEEFDQEDQSNPLCQRTGRWRRCLEALNCVESHEFPSTLNNLEATNKCGSKK